MKHPNASVVAATTAIGALVLYIANRFNVTLSATDGDLIAGGIGTVALFIGRRGIRGTFSALWRGTANPTI